MFKWVRFINDVEFFLFFLRDVQYLSWYVKYTDCALNNQIGFYNNQDVESQPAHGILQWIILLHCHDFTKVYLLQQQQQKTSTRYYFF